MALKSARCTEAIVIRTTGAHISTAVMRTAASSLPVVVCDMGTSTTRLGYARNPEPTLVLPTTCAWTDPLTYETLTIGDDASTATAATQARRHRRALLGPGAVVTDWDVYEEYWRHLFYRHLCVEPSDVGVVLAEATRAPPQQREAIAEILFESFGVAQLHVGSQALFALSSLGKGCDTALVVESGAGVTQLVPVVDGYAVEGAARRFAIAGRDITQYTLDSLREHERQMEAERAFDVAERVKKLYSYMCRDITKEIARFDADLPGHVIQHKELHSRTGQPYTVDVGYEQFLTAEVLFQPSLLQSNCTAGLPELVDAVISACPIDCRRVLYRNIVLSGGNMRFPKLAKRLQRALRDNLAKRVALNTNHNSSGNNSMSFGSSSGLHAQMLEEVRVTDCSGDSNAVWRGGSLFGSSSRFATEAVTRAEYEERGSFTVTESAW